MSDQFSAAATLFLVLDPFGNMPIVVALLKDVPPHRRPWVILREGLFALIALTFFFLAGPFFLGFLGLQGEDLQIAGGVVLGLIAIRLIFPDGRPLMGESPAGEPWIVPLAIPLVAGPTSAAVLMLMSTQGDIDGWSGLGVIAMAWVPAEMILVFSGPIATRLGPRLLAAIERLSGLVLATVAVHLTLGGLRRYLETIG